MKNMLYKNINVMSKIEKVLEMRSLDDFYFNLSSDRKNIVTPVDNTHVYYFNEWKNEKYDSLPFRDSDQEIITNKGDRVRSKTEKILADKFFNFGIEYKYECPISIAGEVKYPNFTFFDFKTGEEIYWEHFGMMDDDDYSKNAFKKLNFYQRNNFIFVKI